MKSDKPAQRRSIPNDFPAVPHTLEGWSILHQMFRLRRSAWNALDDAQRRKAVTEGALLFERMENRENGESALFTQFGHKADLIVLHFRPAFDQLAEAQLSIASSVLGEFLEPVHSYLSVVEIGLYEATIALQEKFAEQAVRPYSSGWQKATEAELARLREKLASRLRPKIPARAYLCFYPMNKKRAGDDNWYRLPMEERQRLMHDHGLVGRRYGGQVTQIISGSTGLDDWEWAVDLFADDPLVFKKLIYEMRFDESSARYAEFGPFYVGMRIAAHRLGEFLMGTITSA
jgi:peroxiredoxin